MKKLRIVMVSLSSRLYGDGARLLSAILKERGHSVRMVFLVDQEMEHYTEDVQEECMEHVDILCRGEGEEALPELVAPWAG